MKDEIGTPKILMSPCDPEAQEANEDAPIKLETYDTSQNRLITCKAVSYRIARGSGDTTHSGTALVTTRNLSRYDFAGAKFVTERFEGMAGYDDRRGGVSSVDGSVQVTGTQGLREKERIHKELGISTEIFGCCPKPPPLGKCCGRPPLALYVMQEDDFLDYTCPPYHLKPTNVSDAVNRFGRANDAFMFSSVKKPPKFPKVFKNFSYAFWVNPKKTSVAENHRNENILCASTVCDFPDHEAWASVGVGCGWKKWGPSH